MALKTETRTIDGLEVTSTQLPAMRAYVLLAKLGKIAGPALAQLGGAENAGALVGLVFQNLDPSEVPTLAREILASTQAIHDGKVIPLDRTEMLDLVFSSRLPALLGVIRFALEINYAGFFADGSLNGMVATASVASK